MKQSLIVICCVSAASGFVGAQEIAEELRELDREIDDAEQRQHRLRQRLRIATDRIELLRELRRLTAAIVAFDPKIEKAENDGDERRLEELEKQAALTEVQAELVHGRLELLERRTDLHEILVDLDESERTDLRQEAESLLDMLDAGTEMLTELSRVSRDGPEETAEELGREFERMEQVYDRRREVLQLKFELHWAREEGEEEAIRELTEELKALGEEPKEQADPDPEKRSAAMHPPAIEFKPDELAATARLDFDKQILPLLQASCFQCHDHDSASGDLNLQALVKARPLVVNRSQWINVIQQLKVRSMPPADAEQPIETDRRTMAAWLSNAIENFDYATVRQPGYEPARRLTHEEYNNTVRDLTGVDLRPADQFPRDLTASSGFENSANSLFIQPVTLERYVGAAEAIVAGAFPENPTTPEHRRVWSRLLGDVRELKDRSDVESVVRRFARRAYRRPVEPEELAALMAHFDERRGSGASIESALRQVLQVILVSPGFLIRTEQDGAQAGEAFPVSDWELASRLSYFLWASMPDDELFHTAETGRLREPEVLAAQVDRMLRDDRVRTLGSIFAAQWLGVTDLDRVPRDQIDNPWATDSLVDAMKQESAMLFNAIVQRNEPLDRLVDADFTFVNRELAEHYRMRGVEGDAMRQVSLRDSPRRGILGHGSILAVTSFPGRTSPVVRGNWILSRLLGTPPPPPPPNVSQFDERVADNDRLTQRQKLERHRSNPNCYACHSQIDPLGFAMEQFEWFGRYRPERRGRKVDATGHLPGGRTFKGLAGLCDAIVADRIDDLTTQITRKMLSYALGRQLEYYDEATVRDLARQLQAGDRRLQTLIHAIVQTETFRMKQIPTQ